MVDEGVAFALHCEWFSHIQPHKMLGYCFFAFFPVQLDAILVRYLLR